jgi:hypothetical protein
MTTAPWTVGNDVTRCTRQHEQHDPLEEAVWFVYAYVMGIATCGVLVLIAVHWK